MTTATTVRLATRGSDLALRQAATVTETLEARGYTVEIVEVETTGDQIRDELIHRLGKTGAFVRSLDEQVVDGEVDAAVHSMKDVPTEQPEELVVAGVPQRESPDDVLVTPDGATVDELPDGATVGTSSLRRKAQLLAERPDLDVQPLRGNVDTRIEKLLAPTLQSEHEERSEAEKEQKEKVDDEEYEFPYEQDVETWFDGLTEIERQALGREVETAYDAVVLARAGLERAGLLHHVEYQSLPTGTFVPAPGQGALAVTATDDEFARELNDALDHPRSRAETTVERTVLDELGGGCVAPLGVHAILQGSVIRTTVRVLDQAGEREVAATRDLSADRHVDDARAFAADLAEQGGADLIEQAKRAGEGGDAATAQGAGDE
ncbi:MULTISPECIES: hydroxymethylbilane synthase [Halomicrobium]|uniref:Hydroxymethylbilane synthase n=2 Tax=Halomicrobium mukohataei TaxID=57705 RepID=C7P203_HALMD|nr:MULTISPECIES: hydroxymethylbilane synthase [Halomicrobium]ACV47232.1 porphobilinogen deaminase [Halomicrobium mukohataei DSM 12286]QCD65705.1 hydroxymethylbilane synthase [Halomicrobium mukohataei]QFR20511.1 hydroxymethylbilane synthase [Halomicrobium sp. ZPS1]